MMGKEIIKWSLLGRLRKAVKKIRFLLNFEVIRWKLAASMINGGTTNYNSKRRLMSFNDRPGLRACIDMDGDDDDDRDIDISDSGSSSSRRHQCRPLQRTISYPSDDPEDDIDKRAENFIANFYKQLQFERQISLELRYAREDSFNSAASP